MKRITLIFWTSILSTTMLVQVNDYQQSGFSQIDVKLFSGYPSAEQGSSSSGPRTYSAPWKRDAFFFERKTSSMNLIRPVRITGVLTTSSHSNTELPTSIPEMMNTDKSLVKSAFENNGPSDDVENKTVSTVPAKPETHTEVILENTKDSTVEGPVSSTITTTTWSADIQRDDKLFYTNKTMRRKSARHQANKPTQTKRYGLDANCFQVDQPSIYYPNPMIPNPDPWLPCSNPCGPCNAAPNRIKVPTPLSIGGVETTIKKHVYQVSLQYIDHPFCGGSILNRDTILTAAHCFDLITRNFYKYVTIKAGATDTRKGQEYKISKVIKHRHYEKKAHNNDVAILKLAKPLMYSSKVQPIKLQPAGRSVLARTRGVVTGWGTTVAGEYAMPTALHKVAVNVITNKLCQRMYKSTGYRITSSMLCALTPGGDACQGDSGGPLVANGKLIGVVSWGIGCADPKYPGVYANVSALHKFISKYV